MTNTPPKPNTVSTTANQKPPLHKGKLVLAIVFMVLLTAFSVYLTSWIIEDLRDHTDWLDGLATIMASTLMAIALIFLFFWILWLIKRRNWQFYIALIGSAVLLTFCILLFFTGMFMPSVLISLAIIPISGIILGLQYDKRRKLALNTFHQARD